MIERFGIAARYSNAVKAGGFVFTSGQVAADLTGDIKAQTRQALESLDSTLAEAGLTKANLVSLTIFIANMSEFDGMNAAYDVWVDRSNPPARATLETRLAVPEFKIEIIAVAFGG